MWIFNESMKTPQIQNLLPHLLPRILLLQVTRKGRKRNTRKTKKEKKHKRKEKKDKKDKTDKKKKREKEEKKSEPIQLSKWREQVGESRSDSDSDGPRSIISGKKIKMKLKKSKEEKIRDANRKQLLDFLNQSY